MSQVIVRQRNEVLVSCSNLRCKIPVVVRSGDMLTLMGKNPQFGSKNNAPFVRGNCPSCGRAYSVSDMDALLMLRREPDV